MAQGSLIEFTSLSAFQSRFSGEQTGTSNGRWRYESDAGTPTSNTGPGSNNGLTFVFTETSGSESLSSKENRGFARLSSIPDSTHRTLTLVVCIQGTFGDGTEGLQIQYRTSSTGSWIEAGFIYGWDYSNSYSAGDTLTDENGQTRTVAFNGGWISVDIAIPDDAVDVSLQPRYTGSGSSIRHDIALRSIRWTYDLISVRAGEPEVSLSAKAAALASFSARAGNPEASFEVTQVTPPVEISLRAGSPTVSLKAQNFDETEWPVDLPEFERDFSVAFGSEIETYPVMLGPPITRPSLQGVTPFVGIMMVERHDRDRIYDFWANRQGGTFIFPHPIWGDQMARFVRGGGLTIRHDRGHRYEVTFNLEILDEVEEFPRS